MKVIIAGSRSIDDYKALLDAIEESGYDITEVVSGCAKGVDRLGEEYAQRNMIPLKKFPADWEKHGKSAGIIRNKKMAKYGDALIAVWDQTSRGTQNMLDEANEEELEMYLKRV